MLKTGFKEAFLTSLISSNAASFSIDLEAKNAKEILTTARNSIKKRAIVVKQHARVPRRRKNK